LEGLRNFGGGEGGFEHPLGTPLYRVMGNLFCIIYELHVVPYLHFLHISSVFSLQDKYLGIFLSDMKNIATEVSGKAFEKQKILFDSLVEN